MTRTTGCLNKNKTASRARVQSGNEEGQSLRVPPCTHTQPLGCQAADSTAAILWRKKRSMYRFNGLRGFLLTGANEAHPEVFTRALCICEPDTEERTSPTGRERERFQLYFDSLCAFFINTAQHQYGQTPATAPKLRRTLGHYKPFILRHFRFKHRTVHESNTNVEFRLHSVLECISTKKRGR